MHGQNDGKKKMRPYHSGEHFVQMSVANAQYCCVRHPRSDLGDLRGIEGEIRAQSTRVQDDTHTLAVTTSPTAGRGEGAFTGFT